ncbi:MAG: hypothetical protein DMG46_05440 [Acidobacteria bacterium]|nr:MAG: hypothetical protein DMG46_05440 [Acidobacteriota bacterium]
MCSRGPYDGDSAVCVILQPVVQSDSRGIGQQFLSEKREGSKSDCPALNFLKSNSGQTGIEFPYRM